MCNPTKSPPEAPSSAPPPTSAPTATSLLPLSPASTLSSSGIFSSNQNGNQDGNNISINRSSTSSSTSPREGSPPILELVASSGQFDRERRGRILSGQESRDDRNWKQRQMHRQSPPTSKATNNGDGDDDGDDDYDDIPSLVEEEQDPQPAAHACDDNDDYNAWQHRRRQQQQSPSSRQPQDPDQQSKRRIHSREPFLGTKSVGSHQDPNKDQNQTTPKQPQGGTATLPFFVLDYMIEDLVPKHQNAEELADLLNDKETALSPKKAISFSPLRKSKSCGFAGWSNCKKPECTEKTKTRDTDLARTPTKAHYKTSPSTRTLETMPPLPITPKSSNRKHSKMLQPGSQSESPIVPMPCLDEEGNPKSLFVPRNLNESFRECDGEAGDSYPFPKLRPKAAFGSVPRVPPSQLSRDPDTTATLAKKSASCPQLHRGRDDNWRALQLRKRAQEQHNRRERRNKLTVVQRSMTLAQGWNNKGLIAAGKATRAEQQPSRASNTTTTDQEQQHQQQLWESSLECWDNALEIYRSLLGEYHERVADVQNNRGIALGKLGLFQNAMEALGMALEARKKQEQRARAEPKQGQRRSSRTNSNKTTSASVSAAIVSTLHNIANVFRDAGNPAEALGVLVEAQNTLLAFETPTSGNALLQHRHYCWHQSARLSTAIGHVYYESESWREAREAYVEALGVYEKLSGSLSGLSDRLGWGKPQHGDDPGDAKRAELLHHCQLIQREVANLKKDLDELDRCQQARVGSRARLLQARRNQQHQQLHLKHQKQRQHEASSRRIVPQQQQQQAPQQQSIFGVVSSLRT